MDAIRNAVKKRTTNFREDETKLLIQLWGSSAIQNKLYLTHRKAPVMRLLAANMQQRGFYRTPDEIKTRIRNLKCLYHRIKRSMQSGTGLGTIDPDWPHFKAMDEILTKQSFMKKDIYSENVFEGPKCDDIKQELDDIDINDDMESYTSFGDSDYDDDVSQMPPLTPAPVDSNPPPEEPKITLKVIKEAKEPPTKDQATMQPVKQLPTILPNLSTLSGGLRPGPGSTGLPFPLLILNGLPNQQNNLQNQSGDKKNEINGKNGNPTINFAQKSVPMQVQNVGSMLEVGSTLKELLSVQKQTLAIEKERLELEKQKLDFQRLIGTQLLGLIPMFSGILQHLTTVPKTEPPPTKNGKKRAAAPPEIGFDYFKQNKFLKTVIEEGLKKYSEDNKNDEDDSDTEDDKYDENSLDSESK